MAYTSSTMISRTGYSGMGADPAPCCSGCASGASRCSGGGAIGDSLTDTLTSTPILIAAAVAAYFVFRPKRKKR